MDLIAVLLGVIFGLIWFLVDLERKQQRQQAKPTIVPVLPSPPVTVRDTVQFTHSPALDLPHIMPPLRPPSVQPPNAQSIEERISVKTVLQTWRSSIVGLVKLAQRNVINAKLCLGRGDFEAAVEAAMTSVENISRALLHCYGEKPELGTGQEEALELLVRRFRRSDNADIVQTIEEVAQLEHTRAVYRSLSKPDAVCSVNNDKAKTAESIVDSASMIVTRFSETIREHFATEIPELAETCPKCHSMEVSVMAFNESTARCTCTQCLHSWNEPRN